MSDVWYYAEVDKPVGPISIIELKRVLHPLKDWKERFVWHSSFDDWCKAGAVSDLTVGGDLLWDDETRGLCVRVYGDDSKSFIFVYCIDGRQRFIRIGQSPVWSLEAARMRAKELRAIVDQGYDPRNFEAQPGVTLPS
jgi:Arm DNA-binding domain/GYF domain 2